jgi:23S rRNA (uracil1939-C5)-methyltransferase
MDTHKNSITVRAEFSAYGGISIGRYNGKIVLIRGDIIPGETAELRIEEEKKDYFRASVLNIRESSPDRIQPACTYFGSCGGCHLQSVSYPKQVELKKQILSDCLKRIAKIEPRLSDDLIHDNPWHYRCRGQFKVSPGKIGFFRESSREIIAIDTCPLMKEEVNEYFQKAKSLLSAFPCSEIHISSSDCAIALIKTPTRALNKKVLDEKASEFLRSGFAGLCIETGDHRILRYGSAYITLMLEKLNYTVSPASFLQSNWTLNQLVVSRIKERLGELRGKKVLDLYAGAGNFSLPLANSAEVTCTEVNTYAIEDGKRNLDINNMKNCTFICSRAEDVHMQGKSDILLLDPPRPGVTNRVMHKILDTMPEIIVYISCNPATFARDLKKLLIKYNIESIQFVDFFPQTFHIESLAFLTKKVLQR